MTNENIIENLKRCPKFEGCSQNLCPLDFELESRSGSTQDKCRYFREAKRTRIGKREFISGGSIMPDAISKFVPESNLMRLNEASKERWHDIKKEGIHLYDSK